MRWNLFERLMLDCLRKHLAGGTAKPPAGGEVVWRAFAQMNATRPVALHALHPIPFGEIAAYSALHRVRFEPRHVDLLRKLDGVWMASMSGASGAPGPSPSQPITADAFDAVFA